MIKGSPEFKAKYYGELPAQVEKQAQLFYQLRSLGVADLIEKVSKKTLTPPPVLLYREDPVGSNEYISNILTGDQEVYRQRVARISYENGWGVHYVNPKMDEDGRWDINLHMYLQEPIWTNSLPNPRNIGMQRVFISWTTDETLGITGKEKTFLGILPEDGEVRLRLVRKGLDQALGNPIQYFTRPESDKIIRIGGSGRIG